MRGGRRRAGLQGRAEAATSVSVVRAQQVSITFALPVCRPICAAVAGSTAQEASTGNIQAGLLGSLVTIPANTKYETVLWYGTGINAGEL